MTIVYGILVLIVLGFALYFSIRSISSWANGELREINKSDAKIEVWKYMLNESPSPQQLETKAKEYTNLAVQANTIKDKEKYVNLSNYFLEMAVKLEAKGPE